MASVKICPGCGASNLPRAGECEQCGIGIFGVALTDASNESSTEPKQPEPKTVTCPDCDNTFSIGTERCPYCSTPLQPERQSGVLHAVLHFPWGPVEIHDRLPIGRDEGFSPLGHVIANTPNPANPKGDYLNVSGRHADLYIEGQILYLRDLGSTNGTFVNGRRVGNHSPVPVDHGVELRFGADLTATAELSQ